VVSITNTWPTGLFCFSHLVFPLECSSVGIYLASRTLQHGQQFDGPVLCGSNPFFPIDSIQCQSKRFALTRFHNFLWIRPSWYFAADPELFPFYCCMIFSIFYLFIFYSLLLFLLSFL